MQEVFTQSIVEIDLSHSDILSQNAERSSRVSAISEISFIERVQPCEVSMPVMWPPPPLFAFVTLFILNSII